MENAVVENSQAPILSSSDMDQAEEDVVQDRSNYEDTELKCDMSSEEIRGILEVIATTGKFWHKWDMLKSWLSFRLKEVLAEYTESQMVNVVGPQPSSLVGETYSELVRRLDEALLSFTEGPPFTLQRLCEILLTPKTTYRNLSKLALALEKNLLVTSTLTLCTEPYPTTLIETPAEPEKGNKEAQDSCSLVPNGVETVAGDGDEEMAEAEANEDALTADTEMQIEKASEAMESGSAASSNLGPSSEPCTTSEQHNSIIPQVQ